MFTGIIAALALGGCASVPATWSTVSSNWEQDGSAIGEIDLARGTASTYPSVKSMAGRWLRVIATTDAINPDFNIWIAMLDKNQYPYIRPLPTLCSVHDRQRICVNSAWVDPDADKLRISMSSFGAPTVVRSVIVESSIGAAVSPAVTAKFEGLAADVRSLYFKSTETDWHRAEFDARRSLAAPSDIDPLPEAMALLIAHLPHNSHSLVTRRASVMPAAQGADAERMPACVLLPNGTLRLDLPVTPGSPSSSEEYIRRSHACLQTAGSARWLINLTDDRGGNSLLQFAALQPIFGVGDQMQMRNPSGKAFTVALASTSVSMAGNMQFHWPREQRPVPPLKVTFLVNAGCASACESLLIAAKGRFAVVGQPTGGFTTANETIKINDLYSANITSGVMTGMDGTFYARLEPDRVLDEAAIQQAIETGTY